LYKFSESRQKSEIHSNSKNYSVFKRLFEFGPTGPILLRYPTFLSDRCLSPSAEQARESMAPLPIKLSPHENDSRAEPFSSLATDMWAPHVSPFFYPTPLSFPIVSGHLHQPASRLEILSQALTLPRHQSSA
jgi:hypothetical protein